MTILQKTFHPIFCLLVTKSMDSQSRTKEHHTENEDSISSTTLEGHFPATWPASHQIIIIHPQPLMN